MARAYSQKDESRDAKEQVDCHFAVSVNGKNTEKSGYPRRGNRAERRADEEEVLPVPQHDNERRRHPKRVEDSRRVGFLRRAAVQVVPSSLEPKRT